MTPHDADPIPPEELTRTEASIDRQLAGEPPASGDESIGDDIRPRVLAGLAAADATPRVDSAAAWQKVRDRTIDAPASAPGRVRSVPMWQTTGFRIAASIVLVAGISTLAVRMGRRAAPPALVANERVAQTAIGERTDILLPDGTRVTLAPRSRIIYPVTFAAGRRDVRLEGEAYFSVAHDSTRPFTVRTAAASARVLGTEFGVRAWDGRAVDVYVTSGRVRVQPVRDTLGPVLGASDAGRVAAGGNDVVVTHHAAIADYLAWRDGRVVATSRPAGEVLDELGHWFDVRFAIADSALASRSVSVDLRVGNNASIASALDALMLVLDAHYVRDGNVVTVRAR